MSKFSFMTESDDSDKSKLQSPFVPQPRTRDSSTKAQPPRKEAESRKVLGASRSGIFSVIRSNGADKSKVKTGFSFMPRFKNSSQPASPCEPNPPWTLGGPSNADYDLTPLLSGKRVPELWDETADVNVYLYPRQNEPSFKIPSRILKSSPELLDLAFPRVPAKSIKFNLPDTLNETPDEDMEPLEQGLDLPTGRLSVTSSPNLPTTSQTHTRDSMAQLNQHPTEGRLYFPISRLRIPQNLQDAGSDSDRLLAARNLFAFLLQKPLIASARFPSVVSVFSSIASHLKDLNFHDDKSLDFGPVASAAFAYYSYVFDLRDIRSSLTKMLQGVILGEEMRNPDLYYESYTHCVGAYLQKKMGAHELFDMLSPQSRMNIERAAIDVANRQEYAKDELTSLEFPHVFTGFAASRVTVESKRVRFPGWKTHFSNLRSFTLLYYGGETISWPPLEYRGRKSELNVPVLSRSLLQTLYRDFSSLYDLLVNRSAPTTRSPGGREVEGAKDMTQEQVELLALRKIMTEHDQASIPNKPPIPFDTPRLPSLMTIDPRHKERSHKEQATAETRRLPENQKELILLKARHLISVSGSEFLESFTEFERQGSGHTFRDLCDQRFGYWLFVYAVLQSLPLLVVDAPDLRYAEGVEYFLCIPPLSDHPWVRRVKRGRRLDPTLDRVEEVYKRSHCWMTARGWMDDLQAGTMTLGDPAPTTPPHLSQVGTETSGAVGGGAVGASLQEGPSRQTSLPDPDKLRRWGREGWQTADFILGRREEGEVGSDGDFLSGLEPGWHPVPKRWRGNTDGRGTEEGRPKPSTPWGTGPTFADIERSIAEDARQEREAAEGKKIEEGGEKKKRL